MLNLSNASLKRNNTNYDLPLFHLRRLSEFLKLIGSAMFGATFNLVTRVGLP